LAEKVLRLHRSRGFFLEAGLHLVNPEKPVVILPEDYEAPNKVKHAIKSGVLIDVNQNILVEAQEQEQEQEILPPAPTEVDKSLTDEGQVEAKEEQKEEVKEEKPKAKSKSKAKAKDKE
jgi:hypothetical protein